MEELAEALPQDQDSRGDENIAGSGAVGRVQDGNAGGGGKIKHKSLKSRPKAGKRREKVVALERERFAKNMALMSAGSGESGQKREEDVPGEDLTNRGEMDVGNGDCKDRGNEEGRGASRERWVAIRRFIEQTMERKEPEHS